MNERIPKGFTHEHIEVWPRMAKLQLNVLYFGRRTLARTGLLEATGIAGVNRIYDLPLTHIAD